MPITPAHLRATLAALLVLSAALFAVGVAVERSQPAHGAAREAAERRAASTPSPTGTPAHVEAPASRAPTTAAATEGTSAESGGEHAGEHPTAREHTAVPAPRRQAVPATHVEATAAERPQAATEAHRERVFGINVEATPLVVAAVIGSLLLAAAAWRFPRMRPLLLVIAGICLVAAVFDAREAALQSREARTGLMLTAIAVGALHLAGAATAGLMARRAAS